MVERADSTGSIYDLGYRPYDGPRLGKRYALIALYIYSLRAVFGLGRSPWSKAFSFGLGAIALVPATIQLAIASISPAKFEFIRPEDYFGFVYIVIALFCAVVAPEIIGRDQRSHTLPLYFSRALSRADYVSAKVGALVVALFIVVGLPQIVLLLGGAVATDDLVGHLRDNADQLPPIFAGSLIVAVFMASVSLTIAAQTSRRAFATGAVLAYFVIFTVIGAILVETTTGTFRQLSILVSPVDVLDGSIHWLFDAPPELDSHLAKADLQGGLYVAAAAAYALVALGLLYRRFLRMTV